jgi:hypothetical protein
MNLFEGNVGNAFVMDNYHGTGNFATVFRNRLTGIEGTKTSNTIPVNVFGYNRYVNLVGNVLGTAGHHQTYETSRTASTPGGQPNRSIYVLGFSGVLDSSSGTIPYDPLVVKTMLRWGNFDFATNQARWVQSELPDDVAAPASRTLPPSLFLDARPSWWRAVAWPPIGPDVTGGQEAAGHAHKIPAQACYEATARKADGTLSFNAGACYGKGKTIAPSPPTNLVTQ